MARSVSLLALPLFLALFTGCPGKTPVTDGGSVDPGAAPKLPAPDSSVYSLGESQPNDPLVAAVVGEELPWVESLSGAATALVIEGEAPYDLDGARWAAVRAGYPHPLRTLLMGDVTPGAFPDDLPGALAAQLRPGDHLGLVRARIGEQDRWLAIIGRPEAMPGLVLDKELDEGARLDLTGLGAWRLVSPTGVLREGSASASPPLDEVGEWWLELVDGGETLVAVPLYVGMGTPKVPLLEVPGAPATDEADAEELAIQALSEVREAFDLALPVADPTLHTLTRKPLAALSDGTWERDAGEARLRAAGFVDGAGQVVCEAATVSSCLLMAMGEGQQRARLLSPELKLAGVGATLLEGGGVRLVVNLGAE